MSQPLRDDVKQLAIEPLEPPVPVNDFIELSRHVKKYFFPDEWKIVEEFARKVYPGTPTEFNNACISFFKERYTAQRISIEEVIQGELVLEVYDLINHLGIEKRAISIYDDQGQPIAALSKLIRVVVRRIIPQLFRWFNSTNPNGYQVSAEILENLIEEIIIIEGLNPIEIQKILQPDLIVDNKRPVLESQPKKKEPADLFWNPQHNYEDLRFLADQFRNHRGYTASPASDFITQFDPANRRVKNQIRWHDEMFDHLVVSIYILCKKNPDRRLRPTFGKGFWESAEEIFVDNSKKSFTKKFRKHHSKLTENPINYKRISDEIEETIKEMSRRYPITIRTIPRNAEKSSS